MMKTRLMVQMALAALSTLAMAPAASAAVAHRTTTKTSTTSNTSTSGGKTFGLVDGRLVGATPTQIDSYLAQDASSGVTAVRAQLSWNAVEPTAGTFNWGPFDSIVKGAAAHHMRVLALIDFTPAWARPSGCTVWYCEPADPNQFAAFAKLAAARYRNYVSAWEIWNEPNSAGFWAPQPDATAYSRLLTVTAAAIRSVNPSAYIVSAGLAPEPNDGVDINPVYFLQAMCSAGGLQAPDAIGDHPYSFPVLPDYAAIWNAWQQMNNTSPNFRSVMTGCGAGSKPIWITEYGAPTDGPGPAATLSNYDLLEHPTHVDLSLQAAMVTQSVADVKSYPWVGALFFYSSADRGTSVTTNENFFGLLDYYNSPKPSWSALQSALGAS